MDVTENPLARALSEKFAKTLLKSRGAGGDVKSSAAGSSGATNSNFEMASLHR